MVASICCFRSILCCSRSFNSAKKCPWFFFQKCLKFLLYVPSALCIYGHGHNNGQPLPPLQSFFCGLEPLHESPYPAAILPCPRGVLYFIKYSFFLISFVSKSSSSKLKVGGGHKGRGAKGLLYHGVLIVLFGEFAVFFLYHDRT